MLSCHISILEALCLLLCSAVILLYHRAIRLYANHGLSRFINWYLLWRYPIRHTDGKRLLPTCPYIFPNGQGDVAKFLEGMSNSEEWEKQNGSIYRIWSGTRAEIVLTRPDHLQAVFKDSDKHSKAKDNNSGYLMSQILGECVGLISGDAWRTVRIALEQPFLRRAAVGHVPLIRRHVARHFDELHLNGNLGRELLDPAEDLKLLPFWVVAEIFFGALSPQMLAELRQLAETREELFKHVVRGGLSRFAVSKYLPTKANRLLSTFRAEWEAFTDKAYQHAKSTGSGSPIVQLYGLVANGTISKTQLLQTLDESLFANLDVTTGGLSWNLVFLAAHRRYQDLLLQEARDSQDQEKYLTNSLTLLAACVSESSRLRPLAAFSVPQSAPTTRIVDGYAIPPGTDFIVDSYALNIRSEFWGEDAASYRPERFLERGSTEMRYHFWRFGFGPRQCMGKYVADFIIRALLVYVVENYELELLKSDEEWNRNPESWINHPRMQIRCRRANRIMSSGAE